MSNVSYDGSADVLYVTYNSAPRVRAIYGDFGEYITRRHPRSGELLSVTIPAFSKRVEQSINDTEEEIGNV